MENCEYKKRPDSIADILEKIKAEQYAEWRERAIGQFVSDHSGGRKCDHNATEMRPSFISDHSGGANKMVDLCGKDNNVSTNIDLEAWEPCEECRKQNCDTCLYSDYLSDMEPCKSCYNAKEWKPISRFCSECGRPLTPDARAMLEKRLRG